MIADYLLREHATVLDAFTAIDGSATGLACVVDDARKLVGVITDGDLRRALISGARLEDPIAPHVKRAPRTVPTGTARAHILDLMTALRINAVPEIAPDGTVASIHTLSEIIGGAVLPNRAVIMAGGKGTRLGALTRHVPKPLITVAGRPIIEWVILQLVGNGIRNLSISVNHFAEQIEARLGDGSRLGCSIDYLRETAENPLGTAGSLTLLDPAVTSAQAPPLLVLNADLLVEFDAARLIREHEASGAALTMGVKTYRHTVPFGVVEYDEERTITAVSEKPELAVEINTGIYCIDAELVRLLPYNRPSTMPGLAEQCLDSGRRVSAWAIDAGWIDIGTPHDLARAQGAAQ
ncbi:sugar phosphate nucleotidyltransferase [Leucobacter weissii]|nr:sugar phosphate nucleotidyltransferase [Leucobacter weissii]